MGKNARNMLNAIAWLSVTQSGKMRPKPRNKSFSKRSMNVVGGIIRAVRSNRVRISDRQCRAAVAEEIAATWPYAPGLRSQFACCYFSTQSKLSHDEFAATREES